MKPFIIASASPHEKELLKQLGLSCRIILPRYEEKRNPRLKPRGQAELLAKEKAYAVSQIYTGEDVVIAGFERVVVLQGEALDKPKSPDDAVRMLTRLSGREHGVITAFTLLNPATQQSVTKAVEVTVRFRNLSKKEIEAYVRSGEPLDHAGAYTINGKGAVLVEGIEGDFYAIVGVPMAAVGEELKRFGVSLF